MAFSLFVRSSEMLRATSRSVYEVVSPYLRISRNPRATGSTESTNAMHAELTNMMVSNFHCREYDRLRDGGRDEFLSQNHHERAEALFSQWAHTLC